MDFEIILTLVLLLGLIYYFRQAHTSQKNKNRIIDLLVIGVVLLIAPKVSAYIEANLSSQSAGINDPFEIAGILIFAYGWLILIVEKFWEGVKNGGDANPLTNRRPQGKG